MYRAILFCVAFFFTLSAKSQGQTRISILSSDITDVRKVGHSQFYYLSGHVVLKQDQALMYCDSAVLEQPANTFDAFGHVQIVQSDTTTITGKTLHYDGQQRIFSVRNEVELVTPSSSLKTKELRFDRNTHVAYYSTRSTLHRKSLELTADYGQYHTQADKVFLRGDVVAIDTAYTLSTDTLIFFPKKNTYAFVGPSTLLRDSTTILCNLGMYAADSSTLELGGGAEIKSPGNYIVADSLTYNLQQKSGVLFDHALVADSTQGFVLQSEFVRYVEKPVFVDAFKPVYYRQNMDGDTLYVRSDSLHIRESDSGDKTVQMQNHTTFYTKQFQGKSRKFLYDEGSERLFLYPQPKLWSEKSQFLGDSTYLTLKDDHLDSLFLIGQVRILNATEDSSVFNQAIGKSLWGTFKQDSLKYVMLEGNAESVLHHVTDGEIKGLNKSASSWIAIEFAQNEVDEVIAGQDIQAQYIDWNTAAEAIKSLKGCIPMFEERPSKANCQKPILEGVSDQNLEEKIMAP